MESRKEQNTILRTQGLHPKDDSPEPFFLYKLKLKTKIIVFRLICCFSYSRRRILRNKFKKCFVSIYNISNSKKENLVGVESVIVRKNLESAQYPDQSISATLIHCYSVSPWYYSITVFLGELILYFSPTQSRLSIETYVVNGREKVFVGRGGWVAHARPYCLEDYMVFSRYTRN